jgi:hypothetical protein
VLLPPFSRWSKREALFGDINRREFDTKPDPALLLLRFCATLYAPGPGKKEGNKGKKAGEMATPISFKCVVGQVVSIL